MPGPNPYSPRYQAAEAARVAQQAMLAQKQTEADMKASVTQAGTATLGANGEVTIPLLYPVATIPSVVCQLVEEADLQPVVFKTKSKNLGTGALANKYVSITVKGYRSRVLPASILTLLALQGYSVFAGSAAGAKFDWFVRPMTQAT